MDAVTFSDAFFGFECGYSPYLTSFFFTIHLRLFFFGFLYFFNSNFDFSVHAPGIDVRLILFGYLGTENRYCWRVN